MKAHGGDFEQFFENRREQVLPGVLLHVIETAGPVDLRGNFDGCNRSIEDVRYAVFFIGHLDDVRAAQGAEIEGLAARGRIEGGAVQINATKW